MRIAEGYAELTPKKNFAASQYGSSLNLPAMVNRLPGTAVPASLKQVFNKGCELAGTGTGEHVDHPRGGTRHAPQAEIAQRRRVDERRINHSYTQPFRHGLERTHVGAAAESRE